MRQYFCECQECGDNYKNILFHYMVAQYFIELFKDTTEKNVIFAVPPDRN